MNCEIISIQTFLKMPFGLALLLVLFSENPSFSQSAHKFRIEGDRSFEKQDFSSAEVFYRKALEKEKDFKANYNLGNSLISQNRTEEALEAYNKSLNTNKDKIAETKAYHNIGNAYFKLKDYSNSIDSYKKSLRLNPNDSETRKNLALAKEKLAEKTRKKDRTGNNDKDRKNNNDQNNSDNKNQDRKNKKPESDQNNNKMSKNEIDKLLKNIESDENEIQKRVIKGRSKSEKRKKDW
jgi:tetratricopeptide (TPR) repeat protein